MSIWTLVLVVVLTWFTVLAAELTQAGAEDVKNPLGEGRTRGVSLMPIPVMAVFFVTQALGIPVLGATSRAIKKLRERRQR